MAEEPIFAVQGITYSYEGCEPALVDVSLEVRRGECLAVLGANGSGKSTLLKVLDGLYFPQQGTVRAFGLPLTEHALRSDEYNFAFRRRVGLVFQDPDVQLFTASVLDEVAFAPLQLGLTPQEAEQRVAEALQALRIGNLRERAPHHLSGGEKKRVALAAVLAQRPEVWLLDEPTSGLDPRSQGWLVEFIQQQHREGKTIVVSTHDIAIVRTVATRLCVFSEEHRLVATGAPQAVLQDHALLHDCNLMHSHSEDLMGTHGSS